MEDKENVYTPIEYFGHYGIERRRRRRRRRKRKTQEVRRATFRAQTKVQYRAVSIDMQVAAAKLPLSTKALSVSLFFSPRLPPPAVSPSRAFLRGSRRGEHRLNKAEASGLLEQFLRAGHY